MHLEGVELKARADYLEALIWKRYPFRARHFCGMANKLLTLHWSADAILRFLEGSYKQPIPPTAPRRRADADLPPD